MMMIWSNIIQTLSCRRFVSLYMIALNRIEFPSHKHCSNFNVCMHLELVSFLCKLIDHSLVEEFEEISNSHLDGSSLQVRLRCSWLWITINFCTDFSPSLVKRSSCDFVVLALKKNSHQPRRVHECGFAFWSSIVLSQCKVNPVIYYQ